MKLSDLLLAKQLDKEAICSLVPELLSLKGCMQLPHHSKDVYEHTFLVVDLAERLEDLRIAALFHDIGKPLVRTEDDRGAHFYRHEEESAKLAIPILHRLGYDREFIEDIALVILNHMRFNSYQRHWKDKAVKKLYNDSEPMGSINILLSIADCGSDTKEPIIEARSRLGHLSARFNSIQQRRVYYEKHQKSLSPLNGTDLMLLFERGPGEWVQDIKDTLEDCVLNGSLDKEDKKEAERLAKIFYDDSGEI